MHKTSFCPNETIRKQENALMFYCCVTNYHRFSGLKVHLQVLGWVKGLRKKERERKNKHRQQCGDCGGLVVGGGGRGGINVIEKNKIKKTKQNKK